MKVSIDELKSVTKSALKYYGYDESEQEQILEVLMYAQLRGNNQGIVKLIGRGMPKDDKAGEIEIVKETKLSGLLNGNRNQGMVVVTRAMEMAIEKAEEHGFGLVGTFNTNTSTGAIGYYARKIAEQGLIGQVYAGSPETVAHHGSYEPIYGTNPVAFGIPSSKKPVVFDMATSAMAYFGLIQAKTAGESIPGDVAFDEEGELTTDPARAMKGAILPFDRAFKGAGLSMMVEVMTGPMVNAAYAGMGDSMGNWGNLVMAMNPDLLVDRKVFYQQISEMVKKVKGTKKQYGVDEIYIPGERGDAIRKAAEKDGEIEIEDNLWEQLMQVAEKH